MRASVFRTAIELLSLCQGLSELGYEVVSTGGSASAIEAAGVPVQRVEELTGFPEMLDGAAPQSMQALAITDYLLHVA